MKASPQDRAAVWFAVASCWFCAWVAYAQQNIIIGGGLYATIGPTVFAGIGDVVPTIPTAWYGLRAYSLAYATAGGKIANICTPSDVTCADVFSDVNGNLNLAASGLGCNNTTVVCTIKTLYDQSGSTNCTTACDIFQNTIASRPVLVINCVGTKVCGQGNGSQQMNRAGVVGFSSITNMSISVFGKRIVPPSVSYQGSLTTSAGNNGAMWDTTANNLLAYAGSVSQIASATDNAFHAMQYLFTFGTSSSIYVDGSNNPLGSPGGVNSITDIYMWSQGNAQGNCNCQLTEGGLWGSLFSGGNESAADTNQRGYWH